MTFLQFGATWISILESLYVVFVVPPYSKNIARALLKEPKIYFYDIGRVSSGEGARFENLVAAALLKDLQQRQDLYGDHTQLYYVRDKEKREVDFLTVVDKKLENLIEVKLSDENPSPSLKYFSERLNVKNAVQLVKNLKKNRDYADIKVRAAAEWLATLEQESN